MNVNLFFKDDSSHSTIVNFCKQSKKINFEFQELKNFSFFKNQKNLIILKESILINDFIKQMKKNRIDDSENLCLLLPINCKTTDLFMNARVINYPIKFVHFENKILRIFKVKRTLFNNLELKFDNTLYNSKNKKKAHLTEIESQIIKLLFEKKIVDKKTLNEKVLHYSALIDSKSLDSHLYRLRKKLYQVDMKIKIIATDNQRLKII